MDSAITTALLIGIAIGMTLAWPVSARVERFRRIRAEFRMTRAGLRMMIQGMVHLGVAAAKGVLLAGGVVAVVLVVWQQQVFR